MTQVCSLSSSTADVNEMYHDKRLPKGIHIVGADDESVSKVGGISKNEEGKDKEKQELPWGYIFIQHMSAESFEKKRLNGLFMGISVDCSKPKKEEFFISYTSKHCSKAFDFCIK